jgi:hypothetical protein
MMDSGNSWRPLDAPEAEMALPCAAVSRLPIWRPHKVRAPESANADEHFGRLAWRSRLSLDLPVQVVQSRLPEELYKAGCQKKCPLFGFRARANPRVRFI